jgi:hypothetical protein
MQISNSNSSQLLALHQKVLEAHLKSDVELLLKDELDDYVIANRGEISHPTLSSRLPCRRYYV